MKEHLMPSGELLEDGNRRTREQQQEIPLGSMPKVKAFKIYVQGKKKGYKQLGENEAREDGKLICKRFI